MFGCYFESHDMVLVEFMTYHGLWNSGPGVFNVIIILLVHIF